MKNKKAKALISVAMASAMLLSACGQGGGETEEQAAVKNADGKYGEL